MSAGSNIKIRRVKKVLIYPLFRHGRALSEIRQRDESRYLQLLHLGFEQTTYFYSESYDVTLTQQKIALLSKRQANDPLWKRADDRFFWNQEVVSDLISAEAHEWIVPFMSAFIESRSECEVEADKFTVLLISRRSKYRQGCRFIKRGIDNEGNCANFVETEQILLFPDGRLNSFVQIRGSIPLKWSSPVLMKYEPVVYIDENQPLSQACASKHLATVMDKYADDQGRCEVVFINLVDNKKDQGKLGTAFREIVDALKPQVRSPLTYVWFDYHHECKLKGKEKNLVKLVAKVDAYFKPIGFFSKLGNGIVTSYQHGVFRTNCMDNLDRTNVVQSILARRSLFMQLGKNRVYQDNLLYSIESPYKPFEKLFRLMWVNNADAISMNYAGTGALKTDVVRKGKRTLNGMYNDGMNSIMRYYINNFKDGTKQDAIDLMLGNFRPDPLSPSPFVPRDHQETLGDNAIKAVVLVMLLFSLLLLLTSVFESQIARFVVAGLAYASSFVASSCQSPVVMSYLDSALHHLPWYHANLKRDYCNSVLALTDSFNLSRNHSPVETHLLLLSRHLWISLVVTAALVMRVLFKVVKKGSKIGERIVAHPQLRPESVTLLPEK